MRRKPATDSRWVFVSIIASIVVWGCGLTGDDKPDYWPTDEWRTAMPESQGRLELSVSASSAINKCPGIILQEWQNHPES